MTHLTQDHINRPRPAALKIHKDSRLIHKSSSSSSSNSSTISTATTTNQPPRRQPVIIYTHSPEVIHTTPSDFMALVQKLTGKPLSPENTNDGSSSSAPSSLPPPPPANTSRKTKKAKLPGPYDDSSSTSENRGGFGRDGNLNCSSLSSSHSIMSSVGFDAPLAPSPPPPLPTNSFFTDMPLFSLSSQDLYCFPIGCTDSTACLPSIPSENGGSLSPSVIEALKAYHEL